MSQPPTLCKFCFSVAGEKCSASMSGGRCVPQDPAERPTQSAPATSARQVADGLRRLSSVPAGGLTPLMEALERGPAGASQAARAKEAFKVGGKLLLLAAGCHDPEIMENVANLGRALSEVGLQSVDELLEHDAGDEDEADPSEARTVADAPMQPVLFAGAT